MSAYAGAADVGTGTTLTGSSGFFAEILSANHSGIERAEVDVTSMDSTPAMEYVPGDLYNPGVLNLDLIFDPTNSITTIITNAVETWTLNFPDGTTSVAGSGFCKSFEYTDPLEDKMTASAVIRFTGALTHTTS